VSRLVSFIALLLLSVSLSLPALADEDAERPAILVIGDSLSADYGFDRDLGWVTLLEQKLQEEGYRYRVVNAAISGDTTRSGRSRLPEALKQHEPEIVIIQLGGNDGLRGLPIEEAKGNLAGMIEASKATDAQVLLAGVRMPPNYGRHYTEAFAAMYQDLSDEHDIVLVPRILAGVGEREELMQEDGIHPTAEAQPKILDNIWTELSALLSPSP